MRKLCIRGRRPEIDRGHCSTPKDCYLRPGWRECWDHQAVTGLPWLLRSGSYRPHRSTGSCEDKLKTNANPRVQNFDDFVDILVFLRRNIESHYENLSTVSAETLEHTILLPVGPRVNGQVKNLKTGLWARWKGPQDTTSQWKGSSCVFSVFAVISRRRVSSSDCRSWKGT